MRKILSIFAAILVAVAVSADPVVLPATLDVSNVSFRSEGMPNFVIEEGQEYAGTYFDMGANDSSNDTLLYAEWDITIEPIKYNVAVDVYNLNSWRVQLYLLNQAGDTLKSLRYKGSSEQKGQFAIGSIDMRDLAAGDYKLRAHAATAWSKMKLKDVILEGDYSGVSVALPGTLLPAYAELSANASVNTDGAIAFKPSTANNEYAIWNVSFAQEGSYNVAIDYTASNGHTYGVALLSADGAEQIGSVAEAQAWDEGVKELGAIEVPAAGSYKVKLTNATQWSEAVLNSITFVAPAAPKTLYCRAAKDWWKYDVNDQIDGVAAYAWADGVPSNAAWPGVMMSAVEGEADLYSIELDAKYTMVIFTRVSATGEYKGIKTPDMVIPAEEDLYTITRETYDWDQYVEQLSESDGVWSVYAPASYVLEDGFYLVGKFGGVDAWNVESLTAAKKYEWNKTVGEGNEEWKVMADLVEGDKVKACYVHNDVITAYFPDGAGNEYVVDANHAGNGKTIYFQQLYNNEWGGHFYIDANSETAINNAEAEVKAVKTMNNGQLIIIKNGVKYNAQGAVVR